MRGKVSFKAGGEEHVLHFTTNRLCELEERTGKSVMKYAAMLESPGTITLSDLRQLMEVGSGCPQERAGDLIDAIGLQKAVEIIMRALTAAFGIADEGRTDTEKPKTGAD